MFIAEVTDLTDIYSQNSQFQFVKHGFVLYIANFFLFYVFITNSSIQNAFIFHTLSQNFPTLSRVDPLFHASCLLISWFVLLLSGVELQKFSKKKGSEKVPVILFILTLSLSGLAGYRIL